MAKAVLAALAWMAGLSLASAQDAQNSCQGDVNLRNAVAAFGQVRQLNTAVKEQGCVLSDTQASDLIAVIGHEDTFPQTRILAATTLRNQPGTEQVVLDVLTETMALAEGSQRNDILTTISLIAQRAELEPIRPLEDPLREIAMALEQSQWDGAATTLLDIERTLTYFERTSWVELFDWLRTFTQEDPGWAGLILIGFAYVALLGVLFTVRPAAVLSVELFLRSSAGQRVVEGLTSDIVSVISTIATAGLGRTRRVVRAFAIRHAPRARTVLASQIIQPPHPLPLPVFLGEDQRTVTWTDTDWIDGLRTEQGPIVVTGPVNGGTTTLAGRIVAQWTQADMDLLPIRVKLTEAFGLHPSSDAVRAEVAQALTVALGQLLPADIVQRLVNQGRLCILFDSAVVQPEIALRSVALDLAPSPSVFTARRAVAQMVTTTVAVGDIPAAEVPRVFAGSQASESTLRRIKQIFQGETVPFGLMLPITRGATDLPDVLQQHLAALFPADAYGLEVSAMADALVAFASLSLQGDGSVAAVPTTQAKDTVGNEVLADLLEVPDLLQTEGVLGKDLGFQWRGVGRLIAAMQATRSPDTDEAAKVVTAAKGIKGGALQAALSWAEASGA